MSFSESDIDNKEEDIVPIISLNDLSSNNASILMNALENIGCFYLADHGIPQQVIDTAMDGLQTFFSYSNELKSQIGINYKQRGFLDSSTRSKHSVKSKMKYTNVTDYKQVLFFGLDREPNAPSNQWPMTFMPELPDQIYPYYHKLMEIGDIILESIAIGLGLNDSKFFYKYYKYPLARCQLLYYPVPPINDYKDKIYAVGPHTDLGVITILLQDDNGGLQFYSRTYKDWIDIKPINNTLIINIGDLLERWTAYKLKATIHRVINKKRKRNRFGIAFFHDPTENAIIDPNDMNQNYYNYDIKPVYAGKYIQNFYRKLFSHYNDIQFQQRGESLSKLMI